MPNISTADVEAIIAKLDAATSDDELSYLCECAMDASNALRKLLDERKLRPETMQDVESACEEAGRQLPWFNISINCYDGPFCAIKSPDGKAVYTSINAETYVEAIQQAVAVALAATKIEKAEQDARRRARNKSRPVNANSADGAGGEERSEHGRKGDVSDDARNANRP